MSETLAQSPTLPEPIQPPALVQVEPPLESPKQLLKRRKEVARAVKQFVRENRSMQLTIEGKKYPRAEVWQFCGACFGATPMVTSTEEIISDQGKELGYIAVAHAVSADGRIISGAEAACMYSESDWSGKPSFQLRSMAQTRSCSKVLRQLFGDVMVMAGLCPTPAEEMGTSQTHEDRDLYGTPCMECGNRLSPKRAVQMKKKFGKSLCVECEKKEQHVADEKAMSPVNDPKFVRASVEQVKARKAAKAQPIVQALDQHLQDEPLAGD